MEGCYCPDPALGIAIEESLEFYGLTPSPTAANRRPLPAKTLGDQMRRVALGRNVVALVARSVPVGRENRRLIERLVDSACQRIEEAERPALGSKYAGTGEAAVVAYAAAGGGAIGTFESFRRTFASSAELLEPVVDRRDAQPQPLTTNPTREPARRNPPGSSSPAKTNPTRTIRSSRWIGKAVRTCGQKGGEE